MQPAASAVAILTALSVSGKLNGVMIPTLPDRLAPDDAEALLEVARRALDLDRERRVVVEALDRVGHLAARHLERLADVDALEQRERLRVSLDSPPAIARSMPAAVERATGGPTPRQRSLAAATARPTSRSPASATCRTGLPVEGFVTSRAPPSAGRHPLVRR